MCLASRSRPGANPLMLGPDVPSEQFDESSAHWQTGPTYAQGDNGFRSTAGPPPYLGASTHRCSRSTLRADPAGGFFVAAKTSAQRPNPQTRGERDGYGTDLRHD